MAYGLKYYFRFQAVNGDDMYIGLFKRDYTGVSVQRAMGQAPVLRREKNDNIWGSSLELYPECIVDQEFSELYTSDPYEWKVELRNESEQEVVWTGYVSPELYSEPDVAPPYDVQIVATDGLGELKFHDFSLEELRIHTAASDDVVKFDWPSLLDYIFSKTGFDFSPEGKPALVLSTMSISVPFYLSMDCSIFEEKTLYDTLQALLQILHASVFRWKERWFIFRETDFSVRSIPLRGQFLANVKYWPGSAATLAVPITDFGSVNKGGFWPIERLTTQVQPAKRRIEVSEECRYNESIMKNPELDWKLVEGSDEDNWTLPGWERSAYNTTRKQINGEDGVQLSGGYTADSDGKVSQTGPYIDSVLTGKFTLKFKAAAIGSSSSNERYILVKVYTKSGNTYTYYDRSIDSTGQVSYRWLTTSDPSKISPLRFDLADTSTALSGADFPVEEFSFDFNGLPAGQLNIELIATSYSNAVWVGSCYLYLSPDSQFKGTRCVVDINNGAREPLDTIEVDVLNGTEEQDIMREDIILDPSGQSITSWSSSKITSTRSIEFLALDNALSYALPRLKLSGTLFIPAAETCYPVALRSSYNGIYYIMEAFSWNLLDSEMEVEMVSAPAADISIDNMTVQIIDEKQ